MNQTSRINRAAIKSGKRLARKSGGSIDEKALLDAKVQVMPLWGRLTLFGLGVVACAGGFSGWPVAHLIVQIGLFILGLFLMSWGIFGAKKTLSRIIDGLDSGTGADLLGGIVEGIGSAIVSALD